MNDLRVLEIVTDEEQLAAALWASEWTRIPWAAAQHLPGYEAWASSTRRRAEGLAAYLRGAA